MPKRAEVGDALAEHALADDAQARAAQIADRIVEEAELARLLPAPGQHRAR